MKSLDIKGITSRRRRLSRYDTDAEVRKHGYQTGLETPVVHAVNDECYILVHDFNILD